MWAKSIYPLREPIDPLHVTMYFTATENDAYDELWQQINGQTFQVTYSCMYLGPQGMAIAASLPEELKPYYKGEDSVPHVSLAISKNHSQKQLGPMVRLASTLQYEVTEREGVFL